MFTSYRAAQRLLALTAALAALLISPNLWAKPYKGAEIYSNQSYLYGRFEMRMRVAKASGVLSTFFTYKNGSELGNTFWEEIDIEVFGKNNATQWQSNIILGSQRPTLMSDAVHSADTSLGDAYHIYVLEWTPNYVSWLLDGKEVRRIEGGSTVTSLANAESLRFNIWASESVSWAGAWEPAALPVYQFVDYLIYQPYNATTKGFDTGWRDDFNNFDSARWSKANWTFDGNRVDFAPENALVKEGILVLALTAENATGFSGDLPKDTSSTASSAALSSSAQSSSVQSSTPKSVAASSLAASLPATSTATLSSPASSTASTTTPAKSGGGGVFSLGLLSLLMSLLLVSPRSARHLP